ncbi:MAG TPA: type II toxin-antitoxin system VapB family antitoxin [Acidimicrobiales bacterium]|jgi:Arc/MetJ family transcription regulator|nr:type II toxin-antitoxin system VapB family antitoxin [Acidimicrobiales bacterium]
MARTNVDIDIEACSIVMKRFGFGTKREAVNFALRELAGELALDEARALRGSGWSGDIEAMRESRVDGSPS